MATPPPGDGALVAPETMIEGARQRAQAAVNTELVMLYWSIGKRLREDELGGKRAEYGQAVVKQLAARLTERHGRGYSRQNLERMMRFADWLDSTEKCSTLSSILSWSHFTELLVISDEPRRESRPTDLLRTVAQLDHSPVSLIWLISTIGERGYSSERSRTSR